jgi:hypothetical protein
MRRSKRYFQYIHKVCRQLPVDPVTFRIHVRRLCSHASIEAKADGINLTNTCCHQVNRPYNSSIVVLYI